MDQMYHKSSVKVKALFLVMFLIGESFCNEMPSIFPIPLSVEMGTGVCVLDSSTSVFFPARSNQKDNFVRSLFMREVIDRFGVPLHGSTNPSENNTVVIGVLEDPMVKRYCDEFHLTATLRRLGDEGYILKVTGHTIFIFANKPNGELFGFETLRQIVKKQHGNSIAIPQLTVMDKPLLRFRGIKLYLPGRKNIPFFKRFIKDFVAMYKFNKILLELNANMRLDKHPELNVGTVNFAKSLMYSRLSDPHGLNNIYKNSTHWDNADGEVLEKQEIKDLVQYMRSYSIEVIPELPSLSHSYYLLFGHRDLAANPQEVYPDTYNPLNPKIYDLYFDVLDEYIDVIHPKMIHVGHDEWQVDESEFKKSEDHDYNLMYANDLKKIHDHLAKKGIRTAIWGDHLMQSVRGKGYREWTMPGGYTYRVPGALSADQVKKLIPKDILIFNWFWDDRYKRESDSLISNWGFQQAYGNMRADMNHWDERIKVSGMIGGEPSSWAGTTEENIGKDQLVNFLGCSNLLWSTHILAFDSLIFTFEPFVYTIKEHLSGTVLPSDDGNPSQALDISSSFNSSLQHGWDSLDVNNLSVGNVRSRNVVFNIPGASENGNRAISAVTSQDISAGTQDNTIPLNQDVSSIVFLHACAKNAANKKAYYEMYDFDDTADLLGWYTVTYEDGFVETIPIRYGVNIMDWGWHQRIVKNEKETVHYNQDKYAYEASAVACSKNNNDSITFFAFEWKNPRFGEAIKSISLKSVAFNKDNQNAVVLLGMSIVPPREIQKDLIRSTIKE